MVISAASVPAGQRGTVLSQHPEPSLLVREECSKGTGRVASALVRTEVGHRAGAQESCAQKWGTGKGRACMKVLRWAMTRSIASSRSSTLICASCLCICSCTCSTARACNRVFATRRLGLATCHLFWGWTQRLPLERLIPRCQLGSARRCEVLTQRASHVIPLRSCFSRSCLDGGVGCAE